MPSEVPTDTALVKAAPAKETCPQTVGHTAPRRARNSSTTQSLLEELLNTVKATASATGKRSSTNMAGQPPAKRQQHTAICVFCGEHHSAVMCERFKSSAQRWGILGAKGLCHSCGGKHQQATCNKRDRKCQVCKKPHLSALCQAYLTEETITAAITKPSKAASDTTVKEQEGHNQA
uniref:Uncharacterized protein n=1 Tax=Caenorhabditis japonica TaxID=281687 RepID=A0A8R1INM4_CAEJA